MWSFVKDTFKVAASKDSDPVDAWVSCVLIGSFALVIAFATLGILENIH